MKQIKILLSSVLTLLLITGNNASYASPHYSDYSGRPGFKANKPNMNVFKGQVRKGNVLKRNVRVLPNRGSYTDSGRITYRPGKAGFIGTAGKDSFLNEATLYQNGKDSFIGETGKAGFIGQARIGQTDENCIVGGTMCSARKSGAKTQIKFGGQEGEAFDPTSKYSISDEPAFIPKPDGALGPDVVTTLEHGPGIVSTTGAHTVNVNDNDSRIVGAGGAHGVQQPKGVPLKFINGVWTEDLPYD